MEKDKERLPEAAGKEDSPPIGEKQVEEAYQTLLRYRAGKANLEKRLVENQQWYRLRQWECMRRGQSE